MAKRGKVTKLQTKDQDARPIRFRRYKVLILIVCEDEKTEPYYFNKFKLLFPQETVFIREIGTGKKPKGIVQQAILERDRLSQESKKNVDEVWVVFDKDDEGNNETTLSNFNAAWETAEKQAIKIAFSNEVFELWLLLHFIEVDANKPIGRKDVYTKIETVIRDIPKYHDFIYKHGATEIIDIVLEEGNEKKAFINATELTKYHLEKQHSPIESNPSTTINLLVAYLRDLIEWYSNLPIK